MSQSITRSFRTRNIVGRLSGLIFLAALVTPAVSGQTSCEGLINLNLENAKVTSAILTPASDLPATSASSLESTTHVAEHCAVKVLVTPTSDSTIHFELWLPPASAWSGKYMQLGSGGWGGRIFTSIMIDPLNRGYAVAATDDGHIGNGTGQFALGHPEKLTDWGYRAVHETARHSREIIDTYYTQPLHQAYFVGCSDGGRQGFMEAERFPEDFNGIVAGAPAIQWTHQLAGWIWDERALFADNDGESILPAAKLQLLQNAALKSCDAQDGVLDSILNDPSKCRFDPSILLCQAGDEFGCLTTAQLKAVKMIYSGPKDPVTGEQIYPGHEPGGELLWQKSLLTRDRGAFANSNFSDATFENPAWDWRASDLHEDVELSDQRVGAKVNAYNPDLRTFRDHGGKLIEYQGWEDPVIAPEDTIHFYELVLQFMNEYPDPRYHGSSGSIDNFYRLFMAPGMGHCGGGSGPNMFGSPLHMDADHDWVSALDRWVVGGVPPDRIIAIRDAEKSQTGVQENPQMTRPLCVYPKVARYKGTGSTNDADNFVCISEPAD